MCKNKHMMDEEEDATQEMRIAGYMRAMKKWQQDEEVRRRRLGNTPKNKY